jgi:hypothetical protein
MQLSLTLEETKMNYSNIKISKQLVLAVSVLLVFQSMAYGAQKFTPSYKVDRCDCLGFSEDIPTFLSDLAGGHDMDIYGEGKSLRAAEKEAKQMCVETYRNFASVSQTEDPNNVTQTGCERLKSTPDGEWVSL